MVAGVVILYNPDDSVIKNVKSYIGFLERLYVLDNSDVYNQNVIDFCKSNQHIVYINNGLNLGVAKALNLACKVSIEEGCQWLLTMDQDSFIKEGFFDIAKAAMLDANNIIITASYNSIFFMPQISKYAGFVEIGTVITSGNLLNLIGWKSLGGFCEKLFIDEVDNEFCIRATKKGYKIQATKDVYLDHNLGFKYTKANRLTGKSLNFTMHSPFRVYYMTRNNLFLWKQYLFINPALVYNRIRNFIKLIYEITFYYPDKLSYYKNVAKGVFHFFISKYDKM
jgi:rhamnosyltransferase